MSRRADCYDNAVMEAFFSTNKREETERFPSSSDAKMASFDGIKPRWSSPDDLTLLPGS
jgi:transposase InsO family protein